MAESSFKKVVDDRNDVKLFGVCLALGFVSIIFLKAMGANQFVVTSFPCAILILYCWYVFKTKRYQLRGDRAGDSVYYLGFLYTLLSLGVSLFQFVLKGLSAREIVGNLGIALFTTIIGLAGRVILTQLREDPVEIEESARMALAEAASQVRSELAQMLEDVSIFRRAVMQSITEGAEEVSRETNRSLTENVAQFTSSARSVIDKIGVVFDEFGDSARRVNRISVNTSNALEKLVERIEAIDAPQSLITAKFDPLVDRISDVIGKFNARAEEQQEAVNRFRMMIEETANVASESIKAMSAIGTNIGKIAGDVEKQSLATSKSGDAIRKLSDDVSKSLATVTEKHSAQTASLIQTSEKALNALVTSATQAMTELANNQRDSLTKIGVELSQVVNLAGEVVSSFKDEQNPNPTS